MKDKFGNNHKFYFEHISLGTKRSRYTGTWIHILKYIVLNSRKNNLGKGINSGFRIILSTFYILQHTNIMYLWLSMFLSISLSILKYFISSEQL